jgi:transcriptional regulator with XRE-family HTH domain
MGRLQRLVLSVIRASGLPRSMLARDSGLSRATIEAWVAARREPTTDSIAHLASGLRKRAAELVKLADRLEREGT